MFRMSLTKMLPAVLGVGLIFGVTQTADAQEPYVDDRKSVKDNVMTAPPIGDWKKVSELTQLPDFVPGLGTLYVKPDDLPVGPYLAYDRNDRLVSTVYMVPLKDLRNQKAFENLRGVNMKADHIDLKFNPGHPGLTEPHYHFIVWRVSPDQAETLAVNPMRMR